MDCGEGTYGQLIRRFGTERTEEILSNLNIIFISHLHTDHHMGLINLLKHRRNVKKFGSVVGKVYLLAPITISAWLAYYQEHFEDVLDCFELVPNHSLVCSIISYPFKIIY